MPLYQDAIDKELHFIIDHAECRFALAEDQEQTDKLMLLMEEIPRLGHIIYDDPRGLKNYKHDWLLAFTDVQEMGRRFGKEHPEYFMDELNQGEPDDIAILVYTSGTTGNPKGVIQSHRNIAMCSRGFLGWDNLSENERVMAYLPMAWIGDHIFSYGQALCSGFPPTARKAPPRWSRTMQEIGPTYIFAPPRIWENILTQVMIKMEDAAWIKQQGLPTISWVWPAGWKNGGSPRAGACR